MERPEDSQQNVELAIVSHNPGFHLQVLVQGCQLDKIDLDDFLHHIYQQLRTLENNIAQVLHQHHKQVCLAASVFI